MSVERYCTKKDCPGADDCSNAYRVKGQPCTMEYVAADTSEQFRWKGEGPPPARWWANGTLVYRSYSDYCND